MWASSVVRLGYIRRRLVGESVGLLTTGFVLQQVRRAFNASYTSNTDVVPEVLHVRRSSNVTM